MPARILIADDSRTMRSMVRAALDADGHDVVQAADGREALAWLESGRPDLIITDVNMPNVDGIELVRAVRRVPRFQHTPILVLTTEDGADMKQRGREAGATGWIVKPFEPATLRETVAYVLRVKASVACN